MKEEFKVISKFIEEKSRVLDVGCGDGILMEFLSKNKVVDIRGLEISKEKVKKCLSKGLAVIEGDAENDLKQFPDLSFDYVILSQTLQAFMSPEKVIENLLRVGKKVIVTIPNFGHWKVRLDLLLKGEMPVTRICLINGIILPTYICVQFKTFIIFVTTKELIFIKQFL